MSQLKSEGAGIQQMVVLCYWQLCCVSNWQADRHCTVWRVSRYCATDSCAVSATDRPTDNARCDVCHGTVLLTVVLCQQLTGRQTLHGVTCVTVLCYWQLCCVSSWQADRQCTVWRVSRYHCGAGRQVLTAPLETMRVFTFITQVQFIYMCVYICMYVYMCVYIYIWFIFWGKWTTWNVSVTNGEEYWNGLDYQTEGWGRGLDWSDGG